MDLHPDVALPLVQLERSRTVSEAAMPMMAAWPPGKLTFAAHDDSPPPTLLQNLVSVKPPASDIPSADKVTAPPPLDTVFTKVRDGPLVVAGGGPPRADSQRAAACDGCKCR
jgi:hypothetical protein